MNELPSEYMLQRLKAMALARVESMTVYDVQIDNKGKGVSYWSIRPAARIRRDSPAKRQPS